MVGDFIAILIRSENAHSVIVLKNFITEAVETGIVKPIEASLCSSGNIVNSISLVMSCYVMFSFRFFHQRILKCHPFSFNFRGNQSFLCLFTTYSKSKLFPLVVKEHLN